VQNLLYLLLLLPLSLVLINLLRAARSIAGKSLSESQWQRQFCTIGLVTGLLAWLGASLIVLLAVIERGGFLIVPLFCFSVGSSIVMLILGAVTRTKPGYFLAKAGAAQMLWGLLMWVFAARGV
jgi:hypothetical protein